MHGNQKYPLNLNNGLRFPYKSICSSVIISRLNLSTWQWVCPAFAFYIYVSDFPFIKEIIIKSLIEKNIVTIFNLMNNRNLQRLTAWNLKTACYLWRATWTLFSRLIGKNRKTPNKWNRIGYSFRCFKIIVRLSIINCIRELSNRMINVAFP